MIRAQSHALTNAGEEELVRWSKDLLEVMEEWAAAAGGVPVRRSAELWSYYTTVRIPARTRARGLWLKGVKGVMPAAGKGRYLHLTDKALADFLGGTEEGQHEYTGALDGRQRRDVEVGVDGGRLKANGTFLHGVYRYVLAPSRVAGQRLYAYPEGDNSWKHSQFMKGGPVLCAGMMHLFRGQLLQITNGSGHYQPPPAAMKEILLWMRLRGLDSSAVIIDTKGSKATETDALFEFLEAQEQKAKLKDPQDTGFRDLAQLKATFAAYKALKMVARAKAQREGMARVG